MLSSEQPVGTLLASAARTADAYSPEMNNNARFKGILIIFDVTVDGASASVTPKIEFKNPATGEWELYPNIDASALAATGETTWAIYPLYKLDVALACTNEDTVPLPTIWRLFMDAADADSLTYSVGYQYLP